MRIEKKDNNGLVDFGSLNAGVVFTSPEYSDMVFMTCYNVRDDASDYEDFKNNYVLNAMVLEDDPGAVVHFDDTDMVRPYYNCTLTLSD